jgi:ATP-dependent Clp protease adaptor protein ClpS
MLETVKEKKSKKKDKKKDKSTLIIYNDDVNSFEWVIKSLIDICEHTPEQAHQCALIAHNKGKCDVKHGEKEILLDMKRKLNERKIEAIVED